MKTLRFTGHSDDLLLLEVDGEPTQEASLYAIAGGYRVRSEAEGSALRVIGQYAAGKNACWSIGVAQDDEGINLPAWPMRFETAAPSGFPDPKAYSVVLIIEAPDDVVITDLKELDE